MTITDFVTYVRNMHNATADSNWSDAEIYSLAEARANEITSIIGLIQGLSTQSTVAGTQSYSYPSNAVFIKRVLYAGRGLKELTFREWEERVVSGTAPSGNPFEYMVWNNLIYLVPTPNAIATLTIYSENQQSSITSASSTIDIPSVLHGRLADGVISLMYAKDLNSQMATFFESKWNNSHMTAFREFKNKRRGSCFLPGDSDTALNTDFGVI